MFQKELLYQTVELFYHVTNEQPEHICTLIFILQDPTYNVQRLKEKDGTPKLLQLLLLNKGKEQEIFFVLQKNSQKAKLQAILVKWLLSRLPGTVYLVQLKNYLEKQKIRLKKILGSENVKILANYRAAYSIKNLLR